MDTHVVRLGPGEDLKAALDAVVRRQAWPAACVLSAVGSLTRVAIRFAGAEVLTMLDGPFELVVLSGTLGHQSGSHLHLVVSDSDGRAFGGHLKEGAVVHTTAEVVLVRLDGWRFSRLIDPVTGYPELWAQPES